MSNYKEFRSLFYYRVEFGFLIRLLNIFYRRLDSLYFCTPEIGKGLYIVHGFSTILNAQSIGDNCIIYQNVTIGLNERSEKGPVIKNNVRICAGAMVLGNITIGNDSIIGAGALVLKNVPDNCTVIGNPAYIIKKNGIQVKEYL
jgi:serine O-acetyltransferase